MSSQEIIKEISRLPINKRILVIEKPWIMKIFYEAR
jgi:hypothetical protein